MTMNNVQIPVENNTLDHEAARNLAFLLCCIRSGEQLSEDEEDNVRRVIGLLNERANTKGDQSI